MPDINRKDIQTALNIFFKLSQEPDGAQAQSTWQAMLEVKESTTEAIEIAIKTTRSNSRY